MSELSDYVRGRVVEAARHDPIAFLRYVMRHKDGRPWAIGRHHRRWQRELGSARRLVLLAPAEHGKTQQIAGRLLFELGQPGGLGRTLAIVSATSAQARKISRAMMDHLDRNERLREVFPHLMPGRPGASASERWGEAAWTVAGRPAGLNDPTVQALGADSGSIQGSRLDAVWIDDVHNVRNVATSASRRKIVEFLRASVLSRLVEGGSAWITATTWHREDAPHVFAAEGWPCTVDRAIVQPGDPATEDGARPGDLLWPEWWTPERIEEKRRDLGTWEFERQFQNSPRDDATSLFRLEWIQAALRSGSEPGAAGIRLGWDPTYGVGTVFVGVDLAVSRKATADLTAFVVVLVTPDRRRRVLQIVSGRLTAPEMIARIAALRQDYGDPLFVVENVQAQDLLLQMASWLSGATVIPHTTGGGERSLDYAAAKLAVELEQGLWSFPALPGGSPATSEVSGLVDDLLDYRPEAHCGDRLAALLFVREHCDRWTSRIEVSGNGIFRR